MSINLWWTRHSKYIFLCVNRVNSLQALIDSTSSKSALDDESGVRMVALFDHEEIGSNSAQGAGSPVMFDALSRITESFSSSNSKVKETLSICMHDLWISIFEHFFYTIEILGIYCLFNVPRYGEASLNLQILQIRQNIWLESTQLTLNGV